MTVLSLSTGKNSSQGIMVPSGSLTRLILITEHFLPTTLIVYMAANQAFKTAMRLINPGTVIESFHKLAAR